jgi:hypothetical protein
MFLLQRRAAAAARSSVPAAARGAGSAPPATARPPRARPPLARPQRRERAVDRVAAALLSYRDAQRSDSGARRGRFAPDAVFRLVEWQQAGQEAAEASETPEESEAPEASDQKASQSPSPQGRINSIQWSEGIAERQRLRELLGQQARPVLGDLAPTDSLEQARHVAREAKRAFRIVANECHRVQAERAWHAPLPLPLPLPERSAAERLAELRGVPLEEQLLVLCTRLATASRCSPNAAHTLSTLVRLRDDMGALWTAAVAEKAQWAAREAAAEAAASELRLSQALAGRQAVPLLLPPPPAAVSQRLGGRISPAAPFAMLASAARASSSRFLPPRSAGASSSRETHSAATQHASGTADGAVSAPGGSAQKSANRGDDRAGSRAPRTDAGADVAARPNRRPKRRVGSAFNSKKAYEIWRECCESQSDYVVPAAARPYFKLPHPRLSPDNLAIALKLQDPDMIVDNKFWLRARPYFQVIRREKLLSGLPTAERERERLTRALPRYRSQKEAASAVAQMQVELKQSLEAAQKLAATEGVVDSTASPPFAVADSVKALRAVAADFDKVHKKRAVLHQAISLEPEDVNNLGWDPKPLRLELLQRTMAAAAGHASRARDAADRLERGESVDASAAPLLPPAVEEALRAERASRAAASQARFAAQNAMNVEDAFGADTGSSDAASVAQRAAEDASDSKGAKQLQEPKEPQQAQKPQEPRTVLETALGQIEARARRESRLSTSREPRVAASQPRLAAPRAAASPMTRVLEEQAVQYRAAALRATAAAKKLEKSLARKTAAQEALAALKPPEVSQHSPEAAAAEPAAVASAGPSGSWGPDALAPAEGASGIAMSPMTPSTVASVAHDGRQAPHLAARLPLGPQRVASQQPATELFEGTWIEALRVVRPRSSAEPSHHFEVWRRDKDDKQRVEYLERETQSAQEWVTLKWQQARGGKLESSKVEVKPVKPLREMQVPRLAHNLSRVLFNPGVHWLREPRTGIYNFDPALRHIADVDLFDYDSLPPYVTSSADPELAKITKRESARYSGSTSSLTGALSQIYFHLSHWRRPDFSGFSEGFAGQTRDFGAGARLPASIRLRKTSAEGEAPRYAVDQDKSASGEAENSNYILTQLGKALENFFTKSPEEYAKHLRVNSHKLTPEERSRPEAYHYARARNLVMRSQLDCSDERLPRRTFDLKTRAVAAVRQDRANWVEAGGYAIRQLDGAHESFEREMYDLVRSAFLKYYFQARIGHMDGIFLAYHSTSSIFGFQYVPLEDMARRLFGDTDMAEQAFRLSVAMLEEILDAATDFFPDEPLKITLDTSPGPRSLMDVFVEPDRPEPSAETATEETSAETASEESASDADAPAAEPSVSAPRTIVQLQVLLDRYLDGQLVQGPVDFSAAAGRRVDARSDDEPSRRARAELPPVQCGSRSAKASCAVS